MTHPTLRRRRTPLTLVTVAALVLTLAAGAAPAQALGVTTTTTVPAPTTTAPTTTTTTTVPATTVPSTTTIPSPTTTTAGPSTTAPTTTTTIPPGTGVPSVPTGGPPTTLPAPGATPAAPPTPVDTRAISTAVEADVAQLAAISEGAQISSTVAADTRVAARARRDLAVAQGAANRAAAQVAAARRTAARARVHLEHLALAAYTGESSEPVSTTGPDRAELLPVTQQAQDAGTMLTVIVSDQEHQVTERNRQTAVVEARAAQVDTRLAAAETAATTTQQGVATTQATLTAVDREAVSGGDAVTASFTTVDTTTGLSFRVGTATTASPALDPATPAAGTPADGAAVPGGSTDGGVPTPTVLGPATLTAAELAGWFAAAGHSANTTVPIAQLAQDYLTAGSQTGVRGDLAFAQSIIETGDFDFPAGGQLTAVDNNFAGIGACDSCATGWRFPDAQTGVSAQEQLLEAYASPTKVATPLVGPVGIGGCCTTWVALAGKWASSLNYGVEILTVYKQILDWAIPQRLAATGLAPSPTAAVPPATPAASAAAPPHT